MRLALVGIGAVGGRLARRLAVDPTVTELWVHHPDPHRAAVLADGLGPAVGTRPLTFDDVDAVVLASPSGTHVPLARRAVAARCPVISTSDSLDEVRLLLALDAEAREREVSVVVGAGFAPGLTGAIARFGGHDLDRVHEVHVASFGTGGPACARQHHHALGARGIEWRDGRWVPRPGGTGRHLGWFPDPVGGADCYHAALPDPILLRQLYPEASRLTARMAATRRDRLTSRLPMLRRPHPEGTIGGVRVELRGELGGERVVRVFGASAAPAAGAAAVAGSAALMVAKGDSVPGAGALVTRIDGTDLLRLVAAQGLRVAVFEGTR